MTDNGPNDNDGKNAKIVFLPVSNELKDKGIKSIIYARTFMSIDYKGKIFTFTVHKEDISKTKSVYDKELKVEIDPSTRREIWFIIASNWLKHVYTEEEIERDAFVSKDGAEIFLDTAKKKCNQLFLDEYKIAYAAVMVNDHLEVLPIAQNRFKNWLRRIIMKEHQINIISTSVIEEVADALTAEAQIDHHQERRLGLRFASDPDVDNFKWYYDLTNVHHEFIRVSSEDYKVIKDVIIFRRFSHQIPQAYPEPNYPSDIFDRFMNLLNVKREDRLLLQCYIISLFIPDIPKPVLMVHGEQGTAKSMLQELIVMLVDPTLTRTLTFPKTAAEIVQQLFHHPIAYYDNLSRIPEWISDLLCRAVTGSGFSKRQLYTDDEDIIYILMRAVGFNGINLAATKADLIDRGLLIQTETIPKANRKKMEEIWSEFYKIRPLLLGYIFDTLVKVLKWKKDHHGLKLINGLPRLADWGEWCEIISRCMGQNHDAFINAYNKNINLQTEEVIEGSDLAVTVRELINKQEKWEGTPTELLTCLNGVAESNVIDRHNKFWPKTASRLSKSLRLLLRTLREIGIEVRWEKDTSTRNNTRIIVIRKLPSEPSEPSDNSKSGSKSNGLIGR